MTFEEILSELAEVRRCIREEYGVLFRLSNSARYSAVGDRQRARVNELCERRIDLIEQRARARRELER